MRIEEDWVLHQSFSIFYNASADNAPFSVPVEMEIQIILWF